MKRIRLAHALMACLLAATAAGCAPADSNRNGGANADEDAAPPAPTEAAGAMDHTAMNGAAMDHDDAEHMVSEHGASEFESAATRFAEEIFGTNTGDYGIAFAPDGDTLYFTRALPGSLSEAIHVVHRSNGGWSEPRVATFSGEYQEKEPYVSPDGERIYFASRRPLRGTAPKQDFDIWYVERRNGGWDEPVNLAAVNSSFNEDYPAVAADGTLVFTRNNADNNVNLYVAYARNGHLLEPQDMGWPINTVFADADPFIAPDGSYLVFSSSRLFDGAQGQGDLYVVRRSGDGWSEPVSVGLQVNNIGHDYGPAMSPDGRTFYFSRGFGGQVWMVPTALLDGFSN